MEPVIFLLDLDGTLQGDVSPQLREYELLHKVNSENNKNKKIRYSTKLLFKDMQRGLIRPHVNEALHEIKAKHKQVEFFIYTASSDVWAKFLLPKVISFGSLENIINKPLFTRSHCLPDGRKSISKLRPLIIKSLQNKYKNATFKHIYLVDNNFVLNVPEMDRLLYCPSYNYKALNCPLRNIDEDNLDKYHNLISIYLFNTNTFHRLHLLKIYYDRAFKEYVNTENTNKRYQSDKYWYKFNKVLKENSLTTDRDIEETISKLRMIHMTNDFQLLIKKYLFIKNQNKFKSNS